MYSVMMKRLLTSACSLFFLFCVFTSCRTNDVYKTPKLTQFRGKSLPAPPGMTYIPSGSILYRTSADSGATSKSITLSAFFIDETEVTNRQYRKFVDWVADSIAVTNYLNDEKYFRKADGESAVRYIDWEVVNKSSPLYNSSDPSVREKLAPMFVLRGDQQVLNSSLLKYRFTYMKAGGADEGTYVTDTVVVMPAEGIWSKDFPNAQMTIMDGNYFYHKSFDNNPVVGVSWKQARAYADWRGKEIASSLEKNPYLKGFKYTFNLPSEAQWQYAAEGKSNAADSSRKKGSSRGNGKLAVNFKQGEGKYAEDGSTFTLPVKAYAPNAFGIYNMAGNVAEWTLDAYSPSAIEFVNDLNPVLLYDAREQDSEMSKRKVVRGGSWKDPGTMLNSYTRNYENQNTAHSYIGFRCVMSAMELPGNQVKSRRYSSR